MRLRQYYTDKADELTNQAEERLSIWPPTEVDIEIAKVLCAAAQVNATLALAMATRP